MQLRVNGFGTPLCVEASQMFDDFASHAVAIQSLTYCKNAGAHGVEVALDIHSYRVRCWCVFFIIVFCVRVQGSENVIAYV
jgi:hypothetical protein